MFIMETALRTPFMASQRCCIFHCTGLRFILVPAGFDAYRNDPIGGLNLDTEDFNQLTQTVMRCAGKHCGCKIVSCLEGGYHLTDLPLCIEAHLKALLRI